MAESDRSPVYGEYIEHPSIPGGRAWVSMPKGKSIALTAENDWRHVFRNRSACLKWITQTMPDALGYVFDNGLTICAGTIKGMSTPEGGASCQ